MAIGTFGKRVFETSDKRILTFRDFSYQSEARFAEHEVLGKKPKLEYLGAALDQVTFTVVLRADMGLHVRKELEAWRAIVAGGRACRLVVGKRRLGKGNWVISGLSEAWNVITNRGAILSATMDVTLKEYC